MKITRSSKILRKNALTTAAKTAMTVMSDIGSAISMGLMRCVRNWTEVKNMNCKDCIHNEICHMRKNGNDIEGRIKEFEIKELGCMDFIARADVQEIKHGEWIKYRPDFCSTCFKEQKIADGMITPMDREYHYCPNCGAKMDGKEVEGE